MELREIRQVVKTTPINQPLLFEGIHGIGKSEFVDQIGVEDGYRVVKFFLGQMSDAGDVLGLPQRVEKEVAPGIKVTVTEFCPPIWWPFDENEKVILFLDELNRAKPELLNVIMDLVLNSKIAGRRLPKQTRIIAGINPIDTVYQVEEMDAALLSRFNRYEFAPSFDEWFTWCSKNGVHPFILNFLSKNNMHIDPPSSKEYKTGEVYPNRRSWKRVSDILNNTPGLLEEPEYRTLRNVCMGIIGATATSSFVKFLREENQGITPGKILVNWDKTVEQKIKLMKTQDHLHMNKQLALWLEQNEKELDLPKVGDKISINLEFYLDCVSAEIKAEFFNIVSTQHQEGKKWPGKILKLNRDLSAGYMKVLHGD